jgi:hypothetical protein
MSNFYEIQYQIMFTLNFQCFCNSFLTTIVPSDTTYLQSELLTVLLHTA